MEDKGSPVASAPVFPLFLGVCAALYFNGTGYAVYVSVLASVLFAAAWMLSGSVLRPRFWIHIFAAVLFFTAVISLGSAARMEKHVNFPSSVDTRGVVTVSREWGKMRALMISTAYGKAAAYVPIKDAPPEGSTVHVRGAVFDFKRATKRNNFDEYLFWRGKGAVKKIVVLELKEIAQPTGIHKWRNNISKKIKATLPERTAAYMLAIVVGERDKKLTKLHRAAGTIHLLAVSGFHVGIVAALLGFVLRRRRSKVLWISVGVWFYVFLTGAAPGALRAALMLQIYLLGLVVGRPASGFNSVSAAGVILLLVNPWSFYDIGWRLSMLAALFISAVGRKMTRSWLSAAAVSMLVWFVTAPQIASSFKNVPVAAMLINSFAVPIFGVIFPCVFVLSLPSLVGLPFAGLFSSISEYFLEAWEIFSRTFTSCIPWTVTYTMPLLAASALIFGAAAAFGSDFPRRRVPFAAMTYLFFALLLA